ncbi:MAG: hypothetical protein AAF191_14790, partial [Verrucomicrobiota bacterium]
LDTLTRRLDDRSFNRFDTYHQLAFPMLPGGWLSLVPRAGIGFTSYSDLDGNGFTGEDSADRTYVHAGLDASFKLSKIFPNIQSRRLGLDQLRHILQPYARYSWVSADDLGENFPSIDRLTLSTKLRPLDLTRFTATDEIRDWNIVRVGTNNQLLTRRNGSSLPWFTWDTYMEFYLQDPEFDRDYSNLFNRLFWNPLPWLSAGFDSQIPVADAGNSFTELNSYLNFQPFRNFRFSLGHFYLKDHPFFDDNNTLRVTSYTRLSDTWGFGTAHFYEAESDILQLQQYTIHRDLTSWTAAIGAQFRDNGNVEDFGLVFSLTSKAFPRVGVPVDFVGDNLSTIR